MLPTQTRIGETYVRVVIVGLKSLLMKAVADRLRKEGYEVQTLATQLHHQGSVEREEVLDEQDAIKREPDAGAPVQDVQYGRGMGAARRKHKSLPSH